MIKQESLVQYGLYICCVASLSASAFACKLAADSMDIAEEIQKNDRKRLLSVSLGNTASFNELRACQQLKKDIFAEQVKNKDEIKKMIREADFNIAAKISKISS